MSSTQQHRNVKLVFLGNSGVGKSSILNRFIHQDFKPFNQSTIGASFISKLIGNINFKIWDTAGQEKYRSLTSMYYRGAEVAVLVFDLSDRTSFEGLQTWVEDLMKSSSSNNSVDKSMVLMVLGNKSDLCARAISFKDGLRYAEDIGGHYFETSAKDGTNVNEVFEEIVRRLPADFALQDTEERYQVRLVADNVNRPPVGGWLDNFLSNC